MSIPDVLPIAGKVSQSSKTINKESSNSQKGKKDSTASQSRAQAINDQQEKETVSKTKTSDMFSKDLDRKTMLLTDKTQEDLVQMAFSGPNFEEEFMQYKDREIDVELGVDSKKMQVLKDGKTPLSLHFIFI
jgi:U3 small nucleolar RNA-associated protein 14